MGALKLFEVMREGHSKKFNVCGGGGGGGGLAQKHKISGYSETQKAQRII